MQSVSPPSFDPLRGPRGGPEPADCRSCTDGLSSQFLFAQCSDRGGIELFRIVKWSTKSWRRRPSPVRSIYRSPMHLANTGCHLRCGLVLAYAIWVSPGRTTPLSTSVDSPWRGVGFAADRCAAAVRSGLSSARRNRASPRPKRSPSAAVEMQNTAAELTRTQHYIGKGEV